MLVLLQATDSISEMVRDTLNVLLKYEADIETALPQVPTFIGKTGAAKRLRLMPSERTASLLPGGARRRRADFAGGKHRCDEAVADVGFADRSVLRDALLLTLAKTQEEKQALGECFDLFFSQPELKDRPSRRTKPRRARRRSRADSPSRAKPGAPPHRSSAMLAQMLMSRDRNAIAAAMANAVECRRPVRHPLLYPARHLLQPHPRELGIARLRDDLDALTATKPAQAERLAAATEGCAKPSAIWSTRR